MLLSNALDNNHRIEDFCLAKMRKSCPFGDGLADRTMPLGPGPLYPFISEIAEVQVPGEVSVLNSGEASIRCSNHVSSGSSDLDTDQMTVMTIIHKIQAEMKETASNAADAECNR